MKKPSRKNNRRGATAVEFALVAQVLFLFVFGAYEFSRLHVLRNLAQDAAYFAARDAMVPGATEVEATAYANEILSYMDTEGASILINDGAGITVDSEWITVQVTIPVAENAIFLSGLAGDRNIVANASMRSERYDGYFNANN